MNKTLVIWTKKIILYVLGLFILAMGVAFSVKSNLGVSPVSSVPYVLSRIFPLSLGFWTVIFYLFCMLLQVFILRREYKIFNLLQIAASFVFGLFTDLTINIISFLPVTEKLFHSFCISCIRYHLCRAGRPVLSDYVDCFAADRRHRTSHHV